MNREEWLEERKKGIGGSDAAAIIGVNPFMTNIELWEYKTGRKQQEDISNKECVKFGVAAEDHIRQLFALDYPEYELTSESFKTYANPEHSFIRGSFDGELRLKAPEGASAHVAKNAYLDRQGSQCSSTGFRTPCQSAALSYGVWEAKTGTIRREADWVKWGGKNFTENRIPQNYYTQILHYFLVRKDFEFAVLRARLTELLFNRQNIFESKRIHTRDYFIDRTKCADDLNYLYEKECEFWGYVERDERPPLIIQGI